MTPHGSVDPAAVLGRLRAVDERSGGRRLAWTDVWRDERERFTQLALELVPEIEIALDDFANLWCVLPGDSEEMVLCGSHSDCVPEGGWLDGILGVHAALSSMAALAGGHRERTIAVVDWADEEGVKFEHSLLGSSMATGQIGRAELEALIDADGIGAVDLLPPFGVRLDRLGQPTPQLRNVRAAVELHIEQGPALEREKVSCRAVSGCLGIIRKRLVLDGSSGHAGATPMPLRRDPLRAASEIIDAAMREAEAIGALATVGKICTEPGVATVVPRRCELTIDLRHRDRTSLRDLEGKVDEDAKRIAARRACELGEVPVWSIDPIHFDSGLTELLARQAADQVAMVSGALHDSAVLAQAGIPTTMMFTSSIAGVSHNRSEDTSIADLTVAIERYGRVVAELAGASG